MCANGCQSDENGVLPFATTWMDLEIIILSEVNQTNIICYGLYVESKENDTNELIYKTEIDSQRKQTYGYQR